VPGRPRLQNRPHRLAVGTEIGTLGAERGDIGDPVDNRWIVPSKTM
jgi:hypothetical protein